MERKDFRIAVVTVSDRSFNGERPDLSGPTIKGMLGDEGYHVCECPLVPDEKDRIADTLMDLADNKCCDLVITTGGTGIAERDVTPEATTSVSTKVVPGISEAIRSYSLQKTRNAMLSRGVAVLRGRTLIVNFPGSPKACRESMEAIIEALPHALGMLRGEKLDA